MYEALASSTSPVKPRHASMGLLCTNGRPTREAKTPFFDPSSQVRHVPFTRAFLLPDHDGTEPAVR